MSYNFLQFTMQRILVGSKCMLLIGATPVIRKLRVGFNLLSTINTIKTILSFLCVWLQISRLDEIRGPFLTTQLSKKFCTQLVAGLDEIPFQLPSSRNILVASENAFAGSSWAPPEADWRRGRLSVERQYMLEPESRTFQHNYVRIF